MVTYNPDGTIYVYKPPTEDRYYEPDEYDEKGKAIWRENQIEFCHSCEEWMWRGHFHGIKYAHRYCKSCRKKKDASYTPHKPIHHVGAYTHVIRDRYSKELFKFHILDGDLPKGYTMIYKAHTGELLPKVYHKLPVYVKELK